MFLKKKKHQKPVAVIFEFVIAAERGDRTDSQAVRKEYLRHCIHPHLINMYYQDFIPSTLLKAYLTCDDLRRCQSGMNKYLMPSQAPSNVKPRPININKSTYGSIEVK